MFVETTINGRRYARLEGPHYVGWTAINVDNSVVIRVNHEVIIDRETLTVDGGRVNSLNPRGTFVTEKYGEIEVDLEPERYSPTNQQIVVVTGEALKSQSRQAIRKQSPASRGIRKIPVGGAYPISGMQYLGIDHKTGEFRSLTVQY